MRRIDWRTLFARLSAEIGPLVVFFVATAFADILLGTAVFMAATMLALIAAYGVERRIPIVPLVSGVLVLLFGALTLAVEDALFIKVRPTAMNLFFAAVLLGGLAFGRLLPKRILGDAVRMSDEGWRKLTWRLALFLVLLAVLNELVWRNASAEVWIAFKIFGVLPLDALFALSQWPLTKRYRLAETAEAER